MPRGTRARPELPRALQLMQALWALDHALNVRSRAMVRRLGITGQQRLVIRLLGRFPGAAPGELARLLQLHPGTVTGLVKRLEARQLVARVPDPWDGHKTQIKLTRKGAALDEPREETVEAAVERALARVPRRSVDAARELLAVLVEELD